jgi:hypothetical protein
MITYSHSVVKRPPRIVILNAAQRNKESFYLQIIHSKCEVKNLCTFAWLPSRFVHDDTNLGIISLRFGVVAQR